MFILHVQYKYVRVAKDQLSDYIHCLIISRVKDQKPKTATENDPII